MTSYADELLLDLGSGSDGEGDASRSPSPAPAAGPSSAANGGASTQAAAGDSDDEGDTEMQLPEGGTLPAAELDAQTVETMDVSGSVREVSRLKESSKMKEILKVSAAAPLQGKGWWVQQHAESASLQSIAHFAALPSPEVSQSGVLEDSQEYQLIVRANNLAVDLDNEILIVHKVSRSTAQVNPAAAERRFHAVHPGPLRPSLPGARVAHPLAVGVRARGAGAGQRQRLDEGVAAIDSAARHRRRHLDDGQHDQGAPAARAGVEARRRGGRAGL
jgi:hypothetical protein